MRLLHSAAAAHPRRALARWYLGRVACWTNRSNCRVMPARPCRIWRSRRSHRSRSGCTNGMAARCRCRAGLLTGGPKSPVSWLTGLAASASLTRRRRIGRTATTAAAAYAVRVSRRSAPGATPAAAPEAHPASPKSPAARRLVPPRRPGDPRPDMSPLSLARHAGMTGPCPVPPGVSRPPQGAGRAQAPNPP